MTRLPLPAPGCRCDLSEAGHTESPLFSGVPVICAAAVDPSLCTAFDVNLWRGQPDSFEMDSLAAASLSHR